MNRLIRLLFVSLAASSAIAAPAPEQSEPVPLPREDTFSENLNNINENSIHRALHLIDRFRHGVFPTDRDAIDAIQREDRSLAAHLNLARDISNATTSSPNPPATTTQPPTTSTQPTTSETTTTSESQTTTSTPSNPPPTTTEQQPTTTTTSETTTSTTENTPPPTTAPTTTSTTTSEAPTTLTTASSTTEGPTTTHKHTTTRTPYTSTYKSTTTLPNGERSTVTAVTVVYPTADSSSPAATTTGPAPGLQTGGAASITGLQKELLVMLGGAAAVAMAL
ncbi:hypothetical protein LV164_004128 [Aspergillus fumigatus]|nr:hypothetical protein KXX42_006521 [Aspergillus fumigatus]KAH1549371.1 hypothetical protein KXX57_000871 [Aspergillus fumigatus]KAH1976295.1 hypothetical protein KXW88_009068 [Aspergillus fumigatus]KAH2312127.1 hypothetical protein KXV47_004259 [Aspergillus fumigatus]KAH2669803.1 hypothetical protein KXV32_003872 [Aspergillus fumigatus]